MAFPQVAAETSSVQTNLVTNHVVSLPSGIQSGNLLMIFFTWGINTADIPAAPSGWDLETSVAQTSGSGSQLAVYTRTADGSEGATVTITTPTTTRSGHVAYRITGASTIPPIIDSTSAVGVNAAPDPPSLTPSGGALDYLFIAVGGNSHGVTLSSFPSTNYTNGVQVNTGGTGALHRTIGVCRRQRNTGGAEDPVAWANNNAAAEWAALTLAIHPAQEALGDASQTGFRIRSGDTVGLNTDSGWEAALNANASMPILDRPFRLRFIIANDSANPRTSGYQLRVSVNGGSYQLVQNSSDPFTLAGEVNRYQAEAIPSDQYANEAATTQLISSGTFVAGTGNEDNTAPAITLAAGEKTELEFCVNLRKLAIDLAGADGVHTPDGSTFDFRVYYSSGLALSAYSQTARVTIANRPGHIGGTEVELSHRRFIVDKSGNIYYLTEYGDMPNGVANAPVMMKSSDGGDSWNAMNEAGGPTLTDLEGGDLSYDAANDLIHMLIQGPQSDSVYYWTFACADHATTPDAWVTNQTVDSTASPNTQATTIHHRADGTVVGFYADNDGNERVRYRIRSAGGVWGAEQTLDTEASVNFTGMRTVLDPANDTIHIIYHRWTGSAGSIWHKTLSAADSLSGRIQVNQAGITIDGGGGNRSAPIANVVIWDDAGTKRIGVLYQANNDNVYWNQSAVSSISFTNQAEALASIRPSSLGSSNVSADVAVDQTTNEIWVFGTDTSNHRLKYDKRVGGAWQGDTVWSTNVHQAVKLAVFTHAAGNGGNRVLGIIHFDKNGYTFLNAGGTGFARYDEIVLGAAANQYEETLSTSIVGTTTATDAIAATETLSTSIVGTTTASDTTSGDTYTAGSQVVQITVTAVLTETLSTSIISSTSSADALIATEALATTVTATVTLTDKHAQSEALETFITATTTMTDASGEGETLATSIVGTTTVTDSVAMAETLQTQIAATTTSADDTGQSESLVTTGVVTTSVTDDLSMAETLATSIVATTTAEDTFSGANQFTEELATSITATVTTADNLATSEALSTAVTATTTANDTIGAAESVATSITATTTTADALVGTETLATQITAVTTSSDSGAFTETLDTDIVATTIADDTLTSETAEELTTNIVATTTSADSLSATDALATQIIATTSSADGHASAEDLATLIVATTSSADQRNLAEDLAVSIIATTTSNDSLTSAVGETLMTTGIVTTTTGDVAAMTEVLATVGLVTTKITDFYRPPFAGDIVVTVGSLMRRHKTGNLHTRRRTGNLHKT